MKNLEFNIEKSTMRELTSSETEIVGGGFTLHCARITWTIITGTGDGDDDGIFDDGFDEQP